MFLVKKAWTAMAFSPSSEQLLTTHKTDAPIMPPNPTIELQKI